MTWDDYYLDVCDTISTNSKCLSRRIGAILVRDKSILVTGYNGPPRGVPHCGIERYHKDDYLNSLIRPDVYLHRIEREAIETTCPRQLLGYKSGEGIDLCPAGHAEENVLITAARTGVQTNHAKMYMNCPIPCAPCLVKIINAGIKEIVVTKRTYYDTLSPYLVETSDLIVRVYDC